MEEVDVKNFFRVPASDNVYYVNLAVWGCGLSRVNLWLGDDDGGDGEGCAGIGVGNPGDKTNREWLAETEGAKDWGPARSDEDGV